ncbi:MAG: twin-arginine translocase subunit TatC [Planctomycetota bacterium]|nr:twin-arginine translocase subunit TatC [Planctomycetota bacterium]
MPRPSAQPADYTMSFGDHLEELRRRLLYALAAPIPLFIIIFFFSDTLVEWLLLPVYEVLRAHDLPTALQVLSPPEFLLAKLKLSLIAAIVLTAPWMIFQGWLFVAPGLYHHERRFVYLLFPGSFILSLAGLTLLYFVMLPLMLHVLVMFAADIELGPAPDPRILESLKTTGDIPVRVAPPQTPEAGEVWIQAPEMWLYVALEDDKGNVSAEMVPPFGSGQIQQTFRVSYALNFTLVLMLGIVIAFQMPLVVLLMGWMGLVTPQWLRAQRKYALVICGVLSAIVTPADAASMLIMLLPLYGLYELGILLVVLVPASAVAEGRIGSLRFGRRPDRRARGATDKQNAQADQPSDSAQTESGGPRTERPDDSRSDTTDDGEDR